MTARDQAILTSARAASEALRRFRDQHAGPVHVSLLLAQQALLQLELTLTDKGSMPV